MKIIQQKIPKGYYVNNPDEKLLDSYVFYNTKKLELVSYVGLLDHVVGAKFPRKGVPTRDTMYALNIIKEIIKQSVKNPLLFVFKNKALNSFNKIFERCFSPFLVQKQSLCKTAFQFYLISETFLIEIGINKDIASKTGYYLSHIFEFDDAYRYRLQDMAYECDIDYLRHNPRKEIKRLIKIWSDREFMGYSQNSTADKMRKIISPILLLLFLPKYKKTLLKTTVYIKGMSYDESDWYWASMKQSYNFKGLSFEERIFKLKQPSLYENKNGVITKLST